MRKAVFLDRDGTVNAMVYNQEFGLIDSPANPDELTLLPGAGDAIRRLNEAGYATVVVSNQPGIAKGRFTPALLEAMTHKMHEELARSGARVDAVYYCLHHPEAVHDEYRIRCNCRKPQPGLLLTAARTHGINMAESYMVGDGLTDVQAGAAAGCRTVWLGRRRCDACDVMAREEVRPDHLVGSLPEAVGLVLGGARHEDLC